MTTTITRTELQQILDDSQAWLTQFKAEQGDNALSDTRTDCEERSIIINNLLSWTQDEVINLENYKATLTDEDDIQDFESFMYSPAYCES